MLTQEDLQKIGEELGSVLERNVFPTLEQMATKDDLKCFATRDDLAQTEQRLGGRIDATRSELGIRIEAEVECLKELVGQK